MRKLIVAATLVASALPAVAGAQTFYPAPRTADRQVQGFGGMTFGTSALGAGTAPTFGGGFAAGITPNLQVIGEGGRMSDIKPPVLDLLGDFTPYGVRVSAWYGEAGVRFIASPRSAVRPYAQATAGFARLVTSVAGFSGGTDAIIDTGLNVLNRTEPMLGAGAGVLLQGGPLSLDLGYRFNKISIGDPVATAINGGRPYQVSEVRIGLGVRF